MMIICLLFSVKKPSAQEHVKATTTTTTNNKTVENDGWDDDDADWGSLEDCKFYIFFSAAVSVSYVVLRHSILLECLVITHYHE